MYNQLSTGGRSGIGPSGVQLIPDTTNLALYGITFYADKGNRDLIWIGNSGLTAASGQYTDGFPLVSGASMFLPLRHPDSIYVRTSSVTNQKIYWVYV